jgi:hypothetical protein
MTNEQRAALIAKEADETLNDGINFRAIIHKLALEQLQAAYRAGADSIRNSPDYNYREDMGR